MPKRIRPRQHVRNQRRSPSSTTSPLPSPSNANPSTPKRKRRVNSTTPPSSPLTELSDATAIPSDEPPVDHTETDLLLAALEQLVHNNADGFLPGEDPSSRPYPCETIVEDGQRCGKAFARKSDLARHHRIHTGDRPYECLEPGCHKSFIQKSALTVHIRTHTGEKPHQCLVCLRCFADSSSLARHRRTHNGSRPYECHVPGCGRSFARKNTIVQHYVKAHPDVTPPNMSLKRQKPQLTRPFGLGPRVSTYATPASISPPHGFAASRPPRSAAYSQSGGFADQPTQTGLPLRKTQSTFADLGRRAGVVGGRPNPVSISPGSITPGSAHSSSLRSLHTPVSAVSSFNGSGSSPISPATPLRAAPGAAFGSDDTYSTSQSAIGGQNLANVHPGHHSGYYTTYRTVSTQTLPPATSGMNVWYRPSATASQSVSGPLRAPIPTYVSAPYGNVAGFSANQLSIPAQPALMAPSFYMPQPSFTVTPAPPEYEFPMEREATPELVDISSAPAAHVTTAYSTPMTSIPTFATAQDFAPSQELTLPPAHPGRLHSAPPLLTRLHSSPQVPTINSWNDAPTYSQFTSHSDTQSLKDAEEEDLEALENEMVSRDISADPEQTRALSLGSQETEKIELLTQPVPTQSLWGQPITYPQQARNQVRMFSSASSADSAASTLVDPIEPLHNGIAPLSVYPSYPLSTPMPYTPQYSAYPMYHTPVTPWSTMSPQDFKQSFAQSMYSQAPLMSPAIIVPRHSIDSYQSTPSPITQAHHEIHDITLATPPTGPHMERTATMQNLGLGIANVSLSENVFVTGSKKQAEIMHEADDVTINSSDEYDEGQVSDSDDEFVPVGRGRPRKKICGGLKKRRARGFAMKRGRRPNVA